MSQESLRPSLTTTLEQRYSSQHAGGTFEVKDVLNSPNQTPAAGTTINATSMNAQEFQSPNGFQVKMTPMASQMIEVQTNGKNGGISRYASNIDTRRYSPSGRA